ncbi:AAA family ATPase [Acinetobacter sp. R933-2]|uniref:ATP-dependent nuclease n=1 Tax=Acinetobacter sp. R933-2 TaxID=2746728 RepID=UPI002578EB6D|nr:AAA family ATPase [Acinetobacter sp. R933-2]MDM1249480.1 AAA family ATPase [Acinetobacter sp. R933-2]
MDLPLNLTCNINSHNGSIQRNIILENPFTCILGPNGSGKTHLLRSLRDSIRPHIQKKTRFISAGRIGLLEQFRSNYDGHRLHYDGTNTYYQFEYESAQFGSKDYTTRRHDIETLQGDYHTLAQRPDILIKIQERLSKLFRRNLIVNWDDGHLKIFFSRLDGSEPYSSAREASGLMHLVGILCALYDDEVGALFIDEPEVSLHPQLQSFLLSEILDIVGIPDDHTNKKIIVIATHSTEMLYIDKPEDLSSLIFCYDLNSEPKQVSSQDGTLRNDKIKNLISKLGQEHKLTLFSHRPLLVEGPSDVVMCNTLAKKLDIYLEASGSQILPVIGKDQIPIVAKLLKLFGKDPVVLADADAIADGVDVISPFLSRNESANLKASILGAKDALSLAREINNAFAALVNSQWEQIEALAKQHPYWINGQSDIPKAKKRSAFSTLFSNKDEILQDHLQENYTDWIMIKNRYMALLEIVESCGVFFLKKGAIESYYNLSDPNTSEKKIDAAIQEITHIHSLTKEQIHHAYEDIVKCLKFASSTSEINEALALQDILLAIVAPCIPRIQDATNQEDLNIFASSLFPDKAKIFNLTRNGNNLIVELKSKIIKCDKFPLTIHKDENIITSIRSKLL